MAQETEIKLKFNSKEQFLDVFNKCVNLVNNIFINKIQRDEYYDTKNNDLKNKDLIIRIRKIDGKIFVALKSPRVFITDKISQRIELEFEAANDHKLMEQIKEQQLIPSAIIEKRRWSFKINECNVEIDKVPFIGKFIEIEGKDTDSIESVLKLLNLSLKDAVKENYGELLEIHFRKINRPLRPNLRATFRDEDHANYK